MGSSPLKAETKTAFKLKTVEPAEQEIVNTILDGLAVRSDVVWCARMNTGAAAGAQFVRFGFPGLSDIIGQKTDGRFFAIEVKRPSNKPTQPQTLFLQWVGTNNGFSGVATSLEEAYAILDDKNKARPGEKQQRCVKPHIKVLSSYAGRKFNYAL